ncbi:MAG: glycosyl transferase [Candidatus Scalindua sp. AMX11]|nr:MAG: glycosyl transferase [Candidatus Scalindua sp.]NOG84707.1 glycosyl transferase [Planctomycetota bacterium]RZV98317.1 MAG: glycosyl transferase [Candidatus Scalindua sp. SCAELEC01]TDE66590.1 MAG: glycosyl transferase [Candidatus Scalindua sp. AMX11]GJQ58964.1 MAG: glycosyl transferase [Candidatus Scalindua sp.]
MADFHQEGTITTIHSLYDSFDRKEYLVNLERKLEEHARHCRITLLLPCLFSELENPAVMDRIVDSIDKVRYLYSVVVALGGTTEESQFQQAREYFGKLSNSKRSVRVVWIDGPSIQQIFQEIQNRDIATGEKGKGQSVWITLGYIFAREDCDVIALHDCDIVTYDRILLGRLIEPTANPNGDFEFCKGYYTRISPTERVMKGRVTRLFVTPFVDIMSDIMYGQGHHELGRFFKYHRTFNYPLAGEFSFTEQLAREINIAYDWGLEVATLSEVYNRVIPRKIAQIDLVPNYEHKHQDISLEDAKKGLHRMVVDIAKFYFTYMRSHGVAMDDAFVDMMLHTYYENALKFIKCYSDDADVNDLVYDRYQEELTVRHFRAFLWTAWEESKGPHEAKLLPSWNRVYYSLPDISEHLLKAVESDNE